MSELSGTATPTDGYPILEIYWPATVVALGDIEAEFSFSERPPIRLHPRVLVRGGAGR